MKKVSKMIKVLASVVIILVVLVCIAIACLSTIVKSVINDIAPQILGTNVKVENVDVRPLDGKVYLDGFVIGPPEGFKDDIFNLTKFNLDFDFKSIFSDTIVINDITIEDPVVVYELKGIKSNISTLMERFEKEEAKEKEEEKVKKASDKKIIIKHFKFSGGMVKIASSTLGGAALPIPLPVIELNGIGEKRGGATAIEATGEIIYSIGKGVIVAVKDIALGSVDVVGDAANATVNAVNDSIKGTANAINDAAESIGGLVNGLFSKENKKTESK